MQYLAELHSLNPCSAGQAGIGITPEFRDLEINAEKSGNNPVISVTRISEIFPASDPELGNFSGFGLQEIFSGCSKFRVGHFFRKNGNPRMGAGWRKKEIFATENINKNNVPSIQDTTIAGIGLQSIYIICIKKDLFKISKYLAHHDFLGNLDLYIKS